MMARPATSRLKLNPPLGRMPVLQFCSPSELRIDPSYQRDVSNGSSQTLIRKIAQHWNWDLCQPLVVARRRDLAERLFVIDGQHRLEAARLRGDIGQLPCVVCEFATEADEAASFVHLNQQRRPLSKLDVFKAALASGDSETCAIVEAMTDAGLSLAPHQNYISWKPGMVANLAGIQQVWRGFGPEVAAGAMVALRLAYDGAVLQYAGTLYPGIAAVCHDEIKAAKAFNGERFERFHRWIARRMQSEWRTLIVRLKADEPGLRHAEASGAVFRREWRKELGAAAPPELKFEACGDGKAWCDQCDMAVTRAEAEGCKSRWCSLRAREVA